MENFCSSWNVSVCNAVFFFFNSLACCKSGGVICGDFFATVFSRYLRFFFFSFPWSTCFFFSVFPKINEIYVAVRIPRVPFILGLVSRSMFLFSSSFSPLFLVLFAKSIRKLFLMRPVFMAGCFVHHEMFKCALFLSFRCCEYATAFFLGIMCGNFFYSL